jgi:hypothetical protein
MLFLKSGVWKHRQLFRFLNWRMPYGACVDRGIIVKSKRWYSFIHTQKVKSFSVHKSSQSSVLIRSSLALRNRDDSQGDGFKKVLLTEEWDEAKSYMGDQQRYVQDLEWLT